MPETSSWQMRTHSHGHQSPPTPRAAIQLGVRSAHTTGRPTAPQRSFAAITTSSFPHLRDALAREQAGRTPALSFSTESEAWSRGGGDASPFASPGRAREVGETPFRSEKQDPRGLASNGVKAAQPACKPLTALGGSPHPASYLSNLVHAKATCTGACPNELATCTRVNASLWVRGWRWPAGHSQHGRGETRAARLTMVVPQPVLSHHQTVKRPP